MKRVYSGLLLGLAVGYTMSLVFALTDTLDMDMFIRSYFVCGGLGIGYTLLATIWNVNTLTKVQKLGLHYVLQLLMILAVNVIANWFEFSLNHLVIAVLINTVIWLIFTGGFYLYYKIQINKINNSLN